jgi:hypothetical protein
MRLQAKRSQLGADNVHILRIGAVLNDRGHESSKLRFLPSLLIRQFHVDKVESLESIALFNPIVQANATLLAGVTPDDGAFVNDAQLLLVGRNLEIIDGGTEIILLIPQLYWLIFFPAAQPSNMISCSAAGVD